MRYFARNGGRLLSDGEFRFYQALRTAVGDRLTVLMKVRVGALCANVSETPTHSRFSVEGVGRIEDDETDEDRTRGSPDVGLPGAERGLA